MTKFHINKQGIPAPCKAKSGNCPLGGDETHFKTKEVAQAYADSLLKDEFGLLNGKDETLEEMVNYYYELEDERDELKHSDLEDEDNKRKLMSVYGRLDSQATRIKNHRQGIFFDSDLYKNTDDYDFLSDDLDELIEEYTNKPRGEVSYYAILSKRSSPQYGYMGNDGAEGFMQIQTTELSGVVKRLFNNDRVTMKDNNGVLQVVASHHDGSEICEIKPITKSKVQEFQNALYTNSVDNVVELLKKSPSITIKKDKRFK